MYKIQEISSYFGEYVEKTAKNFIFRIIRLKTQINLHRIHIYIDADAKNALTIIRAGRCDLCSILRWLFLLLRLHSPKHTNELGKRVRPCCYVV